ncbi:endonuclease/exonuclease/phosphatase family protein [Actinokineospora fastidiosa]|uniref:Endonuclease/exonuclease/phosphatase domain-containing protein n=1 Tax=Actinokineospora fastidiosa TaxID=1816 RepID=A0A918LH90_9PSEU|nr:endonuclease/exonuclease/phosphatase family protein [Actinokineospora fastidiosa]GGS47289.1 hypothetical protein GCM10010171_48160 [Actinokineospora fastidiosa]
MRWCRGSRLLVAAAVGWAGFVLAHLRLSGRWWLWSVVDALPPLTFTAVPLLVMAALAAVLWRGLTVPRAARWWVVVPSVAALVTGLGLAGFTWGEARPAPRDAVRVFAWNTEYWSQHDDPDAFHAFLRQQDADVYLLQEYVHHTDGEPDVVKAHSPVDDTERLRREFPGYTIVARGELLTLTRFPVVARPLVGPDRPGLPWPLEFRDAKVLRTDLDVRGTVMSFYNVHIPVQYNFAGAFLAHMADAAGERRAHFAALLADVRANPRPVVVAGDFNTSPSMGELDAVRAVVRDAAEAGSEVYPTSWHVGPFGWRLDWAFTSPSVPVHRYGFTDPRGLSDHRPQELLLSPPPAATHPPRAVR